MNHLINKYTTAVALFLALIVGVWYYGQHQYQKGYHASETANQLATAKLNEQARKTEKALQAKVDTLANNYQKEKQNAEKTIAKLKSDVANGNRRLRVAVNKQSVCTSSDTKTSSRTNDTTYAELDGKTAQAILGIGEQCDGAIRQLNGLQDFVEKIIK